MRSRLLSRSRALLFAVLLLFVALCPAHSGAEPRRSPALPEFEDEFRSAADRLERALVGVIAQTDHGPMLVGSGFFIDQKGSFLTAAHVVGQPEAVKLSIFYPHGKGNDLFPINVVKVDAQRDIALCRLSTSEEPRLRHFEVLPLISREPPPTGSFVAVGGFPLGAPLATFQFGTVASTGVPGRVQIGIMLNDGNSGGPVISVRTGELAGMIVSVRTSELYEPRHPLLGQQNAGLSWMLPTSELLLAVKAAQSQ